MANLLFTSSYESMMVESVIPVCSLGDNAFTIVFSKYYCQGLEAPFCKFVHPEHTAMYLILKKGMSFLLRENKYCTRPFDPLKNSRLST